MTVEGEGRRGGRPDPVLELVPYDPAWPAAFERERALLAAAVPGALSIEHIGSTSIPGMLAKPTLDILVVLARAGDVLAREEQLAAIGYDYRPGSFPDEEHLFFRKVVDGKRKVHLHVLGATSPDPAGYRLFREYLVACPRAAARYRSAKLALAERVGYNRSAYVAAKERVVDELLHDARAWRHANEHADHAHRATPHLPVHPPTSGAAGTGHTEFA